MFYDDDSEGEEWKQQNNNDIDIDSLVVKPTPKLKKYCDFLEKTQEEIIECISIRRHNHAYEKQHAMRNGLCMECGAGLIDKCEALKNRHYPLCEECCIVNNIIESLEDDNPDKEYLINTLDWKAHIIL